MARHIKSCDGSRPKPKQSTPKPQSSCQTQCLICHQNLPTMSALRLHINAHQHNEDDESNEYGSLHLHLHQSTMGGSYLVYHMIPQNMTIDIEMFLRHMQPLIGSLLHRLGQKHRLIGRMIANMIMQDTCGDRVNMEELFNFSSLPADFIVDHEEWLSRQLAAINEHIDTFQRQDSGWKLHKLLRIEIRFSLCELLEGSALFKLAKGCRKRKLINVVNSDTRCFMYAILSCLHYHDVHPDQRTQVSAYESWKDTLKFDDIDFPVSFKDIPKFERLNNIKVNVHVYSDGILQGQRYNDARVIAPTTVNLCLVDHLGQSHYCGIPSLSTLYRKSLKDNSRHFCERCCHHFRVRQVLEKPYEFCSVGKTQIESMFKSDKYRYKKLAGRPPLCSLGY